MFGAVYVTANVLPAPDVGVTVSAPHPVNDQLTPVVFDRPLTVYVRVALFAVRVSVGLLGQVIVPDGGTRVFQVIAYVHFVAVPQYSRTASGFVGSTLRIVAVTDTEHDPVWLVVDEKLIAADAVADVVVVVRVVPPFAANDARPAHDESSVQVIEYGAPLNPPVIPGIVNVRVAVGLADVKLTAVDPHVRDPIVIAQSWVAWTILNWAAHVFVSVSPVTVSVIV